MQEFKSFSIAELKNLSEGLDKIMYDLQRYEGKVAYLQEHPIHFMKEYNIQIFDLFRLDNSMRVQFAISVRNILSSSGKTFNECFRCKMAVILIIYGLMGSSGIPIWEIALPDAFKKALDVLKAFLEETSEKMDEFLKKFGSVIGKFSIPHLSILICRHLRYCHDTKGG